MTSFFWIRKKVHWSDTDAAGIVWFPRFLAWYEDAEEELYAALGRPRQALLEELRFGMPRVELATKFHSPAKAGQLVRVGLSSRVENPRRIRHTFEIREDESGPSTPPGTGASTPLGAGRLMATGFVRVGCVDWSTFATRDLPDEVIRLFQQLPDLTERQARGEVEVPWT